MASEFVRYIVVDITFDCAGLVPLAPAVLRSSCTWNLQSAGLGSVHPSKR